MHQCSMFPVVNAYFIPAALGSLPRYTARKSSWASDSIAASAMDHAGGIAALREGGRGGRGERTEARRGGEIIPHHSSAELLRGVYETLSANDRPRLIVSTASTSGPSRLASSTISHCASRFASLSVKWCSCPIAVARRASCFASTSEPSSLNAVCACPTAIGVARQLTPQFWSSSRVGLSPRSPPIGPGEAETTTAIFPWKASYIPPSPRVAHVMAFTSAGEGKPLYSGLAQRKPSALVRSALSLFAPSGNAVASRS
mmetsp:Transcript_11818/g.29258  ORF Transcript_11818/g.29258 Transcript_11818/m.29258 type:complete len:258 (-) Transcript_11818:213-986(-)